jgi:hypothetical protein
MRSKLALERREKEIGLMSLSRGFWWGLFNSSTEFEVEQFRLRDRIFFTYQHKEAEIVEYQGALSVLFGI